MYYYPQPAPIIPLAAAVALRPSLPALRRHSHPHSPRAASSLLRSCTPPPWVGIGTRRRRRRRTPIAAVSDDLEPEPESDDDGLPSPWEGALVYRRDAAVHHLEYATTLERLGLGDLSSPDSHARAADLGLAGAGAGAGGLTLDSTPVLVSLDVTRRRGRLRLDGILRTVITLGCFRCAEPAPEGIFANFSLLLTEDPVEEPDVVDLGTIFEEDIAKGPSLVSTIDGDDDDDQDIDWDDRLHFPATDKEIDISKHIRDIIHLEITLDAVCNPNCKGLCLTCGANLNTSTCTCSKDKPKDPKNVKGRGPLKEFLKPMQKR